jgi:hypothetical protein
MNLIGLDLTYAPKDKEQKTTPDVAPSQAPQSLIAIDREFLFMLAVVIVLSGALVMVTGMALAHATRS